MECDTIEVVGEAPVEKRMRPDDSEEYSNLVSQLCDKLKIARHPDTSVSIKAARLLIENVLADEGKKSSGDIRQENAPSGGSTRYGKSVSDKMRIQKSKFRLEDLSLPKVALMTCEDEPMDENMGMEKDELDKTFEQASKSLKLLYLNDQKQLQYRVNEIISSIQSITANPQTDAKLASVGR